MKVITSTPKKQFEPIVFTITIESEAELAEMYARHNVPRSEAEKYANPLLKRKILSGDILPIFHTLREIIKKRY